MTPKEIVQNAIAAMFTGFEPDAAEQLLAADYNQHNPTVPIGAAPILDFIPGLKDSGVVLTTHRVIAEGDFVVLHNTYENAHAFGAPTLVAFDVFRVENGKVAEHWDNLQPPAAPNPSGRNMTDGSTAITDLDKTAANKALVTDFVNTVLIGGAFDKAGDYIDASSYLQHNPMIGDGLAAVGETFAALAKQDMAIRYEVAHRVVGEGNFVFAMSEGHFGAQHTAFFDLFRVEDGKIVEHWDVISAIPAEMAHASGKF